MHSHHHQLHIYEARQLAVNCKAGGATTSLLNKNKEQSENIKVKDLECELEDTKKVLKFTTDEVWLLK